MTVVYSPGRSHDCPIGWRLVEGSFVDVHGDDLAGTVRQCPECARCWIAVPYRGPAVDGQAKVAGVTWRLEKPRERRRRVRAARRHARRYGPPASPPRGRGTHMLPEVGLPPGFEPPSAALAPPSVAGLPDLPPAPWIVRRPGD